MQIRYHKEFAKNYKKRIAHNLKLVSQFQKQLAKFLKDPRHPTLKDHKLVGEKADFRAFSVTGDIRVVYKIANNEIWLYDVGSHNQVY